jgi:hypothetical protein
MGYGGYFELINATPYAWSMSGNSSFHMNQWNFPPFVKQGQPCSLVNIPLYRKAELTDRYLGQRVHRAQRKFLYT